MSLNQSRSEGNTPLSPHERGRKHTTSGIGAGARPRRWRARVAAGVALTAAALVAVTACASPKVDEPPSGETQQNGQALHAPKGLKSFYEQKVEFKECGAQLCANVKAPLDYSDPDGQQITLAINKAPATKNRQGSLLVNPGGPGASGVDFVKDSGEVVFSKRLRANYDLIGFDPRGVGKSTAVKCRDGKANDKDRQDTKLPHSEADLKDMVEDSKKYGQDCAKNSPEGLLAHIDTESAARDMDLIRAVLGEDKLDYLGMSYGTKLGATYLRLFPERADRLVLDGVLDPTLNESQVATGQAKAFERALDLYLGKCLSGDNCPFSGSVDEAKQQLTRFLDDADRHPLPSADGRVLPATEIVNGLLLGLYEPSVASTVTQALGSAMDGDGTAMLMLADLSADRDNKGHYSNTNDAFTAINCVDYPHLSGKPADIQAREKKMSKEAPFFGRFLGYDDGCSTWPVQAKDAGTDFAMPEGARPPLLVGTTGDPATPYKWSKSVQKLIPGSRLLTYKGEGHAAYGRSNSCVTQTVDSYLLTGKLPSEDATC